MAARRPNLAALAEAAGSIRADAQRVTAPAPANRTDDGAGQGASSALAPSRIGQKPITAFYPEHVRTQLKMMAAEQRRSMESMIGEALNDLFAKYGKPEIVATSPIT
jgi:Antitoxin-like ribbon-helix-helix